MKASGAFTPPFFWLAGIKKPLELPRRPQQHIEENRMARNKSILTEARQIERAVTLIQLGARLQVLESETDLSYERLLRLYKEVAGKSPSKGQLPFSTDWFMTWQPNIHASLFLNIHEYLNKSSALDEIDIVIKAYQLYLEQAQAQGLEPMLSVTRAWRLVKFVDNGMLTMTKCSCCSGHFVTHPHEIAKHYVCGLCNPPARAGKGKAAGALQLESQKAVALAH
jgi:flagellar transcriptional activator FlhC